MTPEREYELLDLARQSAACAVDGEASAAEMLRIAKEQNVKITQKQALSFSHRYNRAMERIAKMYREDSR